MKKRILSFVIILVMTLGFLPTVSFAETKTYGDLTYEINNGEITITGCNYVATIVEIPTTIEGFPVTSIGYVAFSSCYGLESVSIPDGVTSIGNSAFFLCESLETVNIPDSVTTIGNNAFYGCENLKAISIPGNVTSIGYGAFLDCSNITSINIPSSVTTIGFKAFYDCSSLTSITICNSIASIGSDAFYNTGYYNNEQNWENDVLYIGNYLIEAKDDLTGTYNIKQNTKVIADGAFRCSNLISVTIPDGVTTIGESAFSDSSSLTTITMPASVTSIGGEAFGYLDLTVYYGGNRYQFYNLTQRPSAEKIHCDIKEYSFPINENLTANMNETTGELIFTGTGAIPDNMMYKSIISSGDNNKYYFYLRDFVKDIKIEQGITSIGEEAFGYCENLKKVTIPDSVTSIGNDAFFNCNNITDVYYDGDRYQYSLLNNRPSSVNVHCSIKEYSFPINDNLTAIVNETTGEYKISGSGEMPEENFGYSSVVCCPLGLVKTVEIENGITSVGNCAFKYCENLTSVTIPDSVTYIGYSAFENCESLTSITIPNGVTSIGNGAFYGCTSLEKVYIKDLRKWLDIEFGDSTSSPFISGTKFYANNEQVTNLVIPSDVTKINAYAFSGLNTITSVTIPTSVTEIGENAFANCTGITDVYYGGTRNDFAQIAISEGNSRLAFANIHYTDPHAHSYTNACDTTCNGCDFVRETTHSFGEYVYNNDASEKADGTKTRTCSICGHKETVTAVGTKWQSSFTDIKAKDFYYKPTLWAVANNITTGTSKTTFSPNDACTRGQIVTFLWRAAGCPEPTTTTMPFTDVGSKAFYRKAVLWAVENGITSGTSKTTFSPNDPCTRGQIATFLWRAKGKPTPTSTNMPFNDVEQKGFYYKAVLWAVENKITSGTSKTTFAPSESCTRGQIVTFLYRAYN